MHAASAPRVAILVFSLALPAGLAGCVGVAQATAMESERPADEAAERWDADAELAQAVGVEGTFDMSGLGGMGGVDWFGGDWWGVRSYGGDAGAYRTQTTDGSGHFSRARNDDRVGDGRCEVWVFRYVAEGRDGAYVVVVDRDGNILEEGEDDRDADDSRLGEWRIDSDRALAIAKDANDGLRRGTDSEHFGIVSVLAFDDEVGRGVWLIAGGGGDEGGGGGGMVRLDAVTGRVLDTRGGYGPSR